MLDIARTRRTIADMLFEIKKNKSGKPRKVDTSTLSAQGWREKDLENYLRKNLIDLVSCDLWVLGQSRPYQPEADLTALDGSGDLWLFELKKESTSSDTLLQIMGYSQRKAAHTIEDLDVFYSEQIKKRTDSLVVEFCKHFGYDSPTAPQEWGDKIGRVHHLVVIADGTDEETIQAVNHWQRQGLDIQFWPYRIYPGKKGVFLFDLPDLVIKGRKISREEPGTFLLNTSRGHDDEDHPMETYMLENNCALACSEPWVFRINRLVTGSRVLLYADRMGFIARGIATPERKNVEIADWDCPARIVRLREFKRLDPPFSIDSIRKLAGKDFSFRGMLKEFEKITGEEIWRACGG